MRHARPLPLAVLVLGLLALLGTSPGRAGDEEGDGSRFERGVVYEVYHGDVLHRLGCYVREVHLPGRGIAFTIDGEDLRVFRPSVLRYATQDEPVVTWRSEDGVSLRMPVFHVPGTAPRRLGWIDVSKADADRLEALLEMRTSLRAVAEPYLRATADSR